MDECNSIKVSSICPNLNDQQQFGFNKRTEIRGYIISKIREKAY